VGEEGNENDRSKSAIEKTMALQKIISKLNVVSEMDKRNI